MRKLLSLIRVPRALLPEVRDSSEVYGATDAALFGRALPIAGIAGDQQAALIGQACFMPGLAKSTYGTGCFLLLNTGEWRSRPRTACSRRRRIASGGRITYAMEGSIFVAGAAIKWLRDGLKVISDAAETAAAAARVPDNHGVYMVPAFVGSGPRTGNLMPRPDLWPDARCLGCPPRARSARVGRVSDLRSDAGHATRWRAPRGCHPRSTAAWRQWLVLPVLC